MDEDYGFKELEKQRQKNWTDRAFAIVLTKNINRMATFLNTFGKYIC